MYQIEMQAIYQQHILDASQCSQLSVFIQTKHLKLYFKNSQRKWWILKHTKKHMDKNQECVYKPSLGMLELKGLLFERLA